MLSNVFLHHKWRLVLTYSLFALEMLALLLRPYFLGEAVNDLTKNSYKGLYFLAGSHLIYLVIGTIRHMYDTRTYSAIYTSLVTRLLSQQRKTGEVSKLSARSTLAREFVDFLEFDLNYIIEAFYNIIGSLILLFFYQSKVVVVCLIVLIPVIILSWFYGNKMKRLNKHKNDELERQVTVITEGNFSKIEKHYSQLRKWQIRISDNEAWNFGIMEILVLGTIVISLLLTVTKSTNALMAGDIIGIYYYILRFSNGLDTIPYIVQRFALLQDITDRLEIEEDE